MYVRDVMTRGIEEIEPTATVRAAAAKMKSLDVGILPVREDESFIGMITDRDIAVRAVAEGLDPEDLSVEEIMSPGIVYCFEDDEMADAARVMIQRRVRRLLVLSMERKPIGMVSLGDIAVRTHDSELCSQVLERVCEPV